MPTSYGYETISKLLPHRYPFLLVDKVVEDPGDGSRIVAQKNVTFNEPFFQGHFPDNPIMPGVLHIEAIAQVCGLMCMNFMKAETESDQKYDTILASVDEAKFRNMIVPGDVLRIETTLLMHRGKIGKAKGVITADGKVKTEATLTFLLVPRKA